MASRRATTPNRFPRSSSANTERIANYCDDYVPIGIASAMANSDPSTGSAHSNHESPSSSRSIGSLSHQSSLSSITVPPTLPPPNAEHSHHSLTATAAAGDSASTSSAASRSAANTGVMSHSHVSFNDENGLHGVSLNDGSLGREQTLIHCTLWPVFHRFP